MACSLLLFLFIPAAGDAGRATFRERRLLRRRRWLTVVVLLLWCLIAARLIQVQSIQRDRFADSANRQAEMIEPLPARPGEIVDRHGRVLATSVVAKSLWGNPQKLSRSPERLRRLADAVHLNPDELVAKFEQHRSKEFLWIKRRLLKQEVQAVRALRNSREWAFPREAVGLRREYRRYYPQGRIAAHLLGLRDIDGRGHGGIEEAFDRRLRGQPGRRTVLRDARGRVIDVLDGSLVSPDHGDIVQLTIDVVLQLDVEREIDRLMTRWKPKSAGILIVNPQNGDLLAMASRPAFDPNNPRNVPDAAWKNVNTAAVFEPGSTFKPFVLAWALQRGLLQRDERLDCEHGEYRMGGRILHDHHPYGRLSVKDVLVKSSNIGMAKIGERLENAGLYQAAVRFGFGRKTGSGLPGEVDGILRRPDKWTGYSTGSVAIGQELAVTPLQLIMAHAALANGGRLLSPRIVRRVGRSTQRSGGGGRPEGASKRRTAAGDATLPLQPPVVQPTVDDDIARWMVQQAMTDVVRRGTGKRAQLDGYTVFGKTGTAQKIDPDTGRYSERAHVCSFVCGAPAQQPRLLVLVVVNEPTAPGVHFGGTVAAPTAARVLQGALVHLGVPPDEHSERR